MTIEIACANRHSVALDYCLGIIFEEFLGLDWRRAPGNKGEIRIRVTGSHGEIRIPDIFLAQASSNWLDPATLPTLPLATWDTRDLATEIRLTDPVVPVIFGNAAPTMQVKDHVIGLPIDVFGSAFFMLSRYEEAVLPDRDQHDRFPSQTSIACRAGFLDRPIIDEYVEILWTAMKRLWRGLERKPRQARTLVSCDVDSPFFFTGSIDQMTKRCAGDLIKRRSLQRARRNLIANWRARRGDYSNDPHRTNIDWIMDVNERAGHTVAFYFIPENTHSKLDNSVSLDQPRIRKLLRHIHGRGHEIGIHPGYNTYKHPEAIARSVETLRRVLHEEGIEQPALGGRQHFLRWETPVTARLWDQNGLDYDTTLAYADRPGFRCGTCHEYPLYDLVQRRPLKLRERPLVVMECSVIAERYMSLGYTDEALALMHRYRTICKRFDGDFTLLWHNSHFTHPMDKPFYLSLVGSSFGRRKYGLNPTEPTRFH